MRTLLDSRASRSRPSPRATRTRVRALASLVAASCALVACPESAPTPSAPQLDSGRIVDERGQATPLLCPGSIGCESLSGALRVGAAARTITPAIETWDDLNGNGKQNGDEPFEDLNGNGVWDPVWIAGFSAGRAATGVHDDNWARVLTFERGDVSFAIVSLDLIGFFHPDVVQIRLDAKAAGLDFDHIAVTSTHQHEGADTMGLWGANNSVTGYDPAYVAFIRARVVEALAEAQANAREASFRVATTSAPDLVNDTRQPIVIDQTVHAVKFMDESDEVFATFVVWGNHPEALGARNSEITSDFPHYIRATLEERYPGSTSVYASGLLGGLMTTIGLNVCPDENGDDQCPQGTYERAEAVGERVASRVIDALEGPAAQDFSGDVALRFRRHPYYVTTTNPKFSLAVVLGLLTRRVYDVQSHQVIEGAALQDLLYDEILAGDVELDTEVNHLQIGPLELLLVPGELYPELWLEKDDGTGYNEAPEGGDYPDAARETPLQATLDPGSFRIMLNQGNDALGYIIPKAQYDEKRPYAYDPEGQYGEDNSLGQDAAPTLLENVLQMFSALVFE